MNFIGIDNNFFAVIRLINDTIFKTIILKTDKSRARLPVFRIQPLPTT